MEQYNPGHTGINTEPVGIKPEHVGITPESLERSRKRMADILAMTQITDPSPNRIPFARSGDTDLSIDLTLPEHCSLQSSPYRCEYFRLGPWK